VRERKRKIEGEMGGGGGKLVRFKSRHPGPAGRDCEAAAWPSLSADHQRQKQEGGGEKAKAREELCRLMY